MYSQKSRLWKIWLDKCLKTVFQRTFTQTTWQVGWNTVAIWIVSRLQYLLNTLNVGALKKVTLSDTQNLGLLVNTLTVDDKHYMLKRDNLTQPIQIQLSLKEKTFSKFFFAFLKSILNYKHLPKKHDPYSWCLSGNTCSWKHG